MSITPLFYGEAVAQDGDADIPVLLSAPNQYLLMILANNLQENPSLFFEDYEDYDAEDIRDFVDELLNNIMEVRVISEWQQGITPILVGWQATVNSGGAMAFSGNALITNGGTWAHTTPAINDKLTYPYLALKKGEWDIRVYYTKDNASGICTIKLNDVTTILTIDAYAASGTNNNVSQASFTVSADDIYYLTLKQASKNASSGNYKFAHNFVFLRRVSD